MNKKFSKVGKNKFKFDYFKIAIPLLGLIALYNLFNLFWSGSVSSGKLELNNTGNSSVTYIPIVASTSTLHGIDVINNTRDQQLEVINNTGNFKVSAGNLIFNGLVEDLDWLHGANEAPVKRSHNHSLKTGLLNPLILITPIIQLQPTQFGDSDTVIFNTLAYDSSNKKAELLINLPQKDPRDEITINTANFNAYELGFSYSQINQSESANIKLPINAAIVNNFSMFMQSACAEDEYEKPDAQKCNQPAVIPGQQFIVEQLPATVSFKLWKQQPEAEGSPEDLNFIIKIENSF